MTQMEKYGEAVRCNALARELGLAVLWGEALATVVAEEHVPQEGNDIQEVNILQTNILFRSNDLPELAAFLEGVQRGRRGWSVK